MVGSLTTTHPAYVWVPGTEPNAGVETDIGARDRRREEGTNGGEEESANKGEEKQQMGKGGDKWGQTKTHAMMGEWGKHAHTQKTNACTLTQGITLAQISLQILQSS